MFCSLLENEVRMMKAGASKESLAVKISLIVMLVFFAPKFVVKNLSEDATVFCLPY